MIALSIGGVVLAVLCVGRIIVVMRQNARDRGVVSDQWIKDNHYRREGGDR